MLSFQRLALRVLEDLGADRRRVLEETGKNLVIRRCAMEHKKELTLLGGSMEKNGYISQVKSMISELAQYRIEPEQMDRILEGLEGQPRLYYKWKDIGILYQAFQERMAKDYVTAEELLEVLAEHAESQASSQAARSPWTVIRALPRFSLPSLKNFFRWQKKSS